MTEQHSTVRVLAPRATAAQLSRRGFLAGVGAAAATFGLVACSGGAGSGVGGVIGPGPSVTTAGGPQPPEGTLNFYNWSAYDDPDLVKAFAQAAGGLQTHLDVYASNEEAIAKLSAAKGTSGYDVFVPTGPYIPQLIANGLLHRLDPSQLPNLSHVDPRLRQQPWDPHNDYSVPKDWGSTGFLYDRTVVKRDLRTWADFADAMQHEASGRTSLLDESTEACGLYFWTQDPVVDWSTGDVTQLDACERYMVDTVAPHVKAYESYPGTKLVQGEFALSMIWNGDARQALLAAKDARATSGCWGRRAPSCGSTTGRSSRAPRTPTRRTPGSTSSSTR
jgi:spermidine/putrescine transport system substrate-binding protein